jgi:hypothetical protein
VAAYVTEVLTNVELPIAVDRPAAVTAPSLLRSDSRPLLYAVAAIVAALAAIAFVLSFSARRDLAVAAYVSVEIAWLWPLAVDGNIVVNTVAGLLLRSRGRMGQLVPVGRVVPVLRGLGGRQWSACHDDQRTARPRPDGGGLRRHDRLVGLSPTPSRPFGRCPGNEHCRCCSGEPSPRSLT